MRLLRQWLRTLHRFVKEVWGNREMAYQTFLLLGL